MSGSESCWSTCTSQTLTGGVLPDDVKCATVVKDLPPRIKQFLEYAPVDYLKDYRTLQGLLRMYFNEADEFR